MGIAEYASLGVDIRWPIIDISSFSDIILKGNSWIPTDQERFILSCVSIHCQLCKFDFHNTAMRGVIYGLGIKE
jgi:hypothetical protein